MKRGGQSVSLELDYPPATRGRLVVWGLLAAYPFGGMTWQVLHHLAGLRRLGFDVWYVEDSDRSVMNPHSFARTFDAGPNVEFLDAHMQSVGLGDRWVFRPPRQNGVTYGALDRSGLTQLYQDADAVLNVCGAHELREEHRACKCLIYLETDPVESQVAVARGDASIIAELETYDYLFTYGSNLGASDCRVPVTRFRWRPTRPPVIVEWWLGSAGHDHQSAVTTVANWNNSGKDVVWQDETWKWSKRESFRRFLDAPSRFAEPLEIAVVGAGSDVDLLIGHGWRVVSGWDLARPETYRNYIARSLGEFSVAKDQYVVPRSGWFSDRTVCYLAAGRPVVIQDTGFVKHLPANEGILVFENEEQLGECATAFHEEYDAHAAAALELAYEIFDAESVMGDVLREVGLL